jgi:hypothetical protein
MKIFKFLKEKLEWPAVLIVLAVILIAAANFRPGTILSGWDNLHPEFNFPLNLTRSFFSVWQEYQGLGLLPGMGHAADFFRQLFLGTVSLFLPLSFVRYFFHFLMLFLGPLGIYFFLKDVVFGENSWVIQKVGGLAGVFFYLFNLATLQLFYVPYEAFSVHFAFLPWLFLVNLWFLKERTRKSLFWLFLVNLLAVAQGYVATFFLVYLVSLSLVFFLYWWQQKKNWQPIFFAYLLVFFINAFWLLPSLYFALSNIEVNLKAKINLMSTEENFLRNQKYGNLENAALLKGFWFDNLEPTKEGQVKSMMGEWQEYLQRPLVKAGGYLLFLLAMTGMVVSFRKKSPARLFLPVFLLGFLMLGNDIPVLSWPIKLLYRLPLFSQLFRFPFTKFSALTAFSLAIFYATAFAFILEKLMPVLRWKKIARLSLALVFLILPLVFLRPVFQGRFFYAKERVSFPPEYFQVFDFFRKQNSSGRIADFPQTNFWGWSFYRWPTGNYSGSGFLWYGIEQPILDRAFDPWGKANENYYWEISYALSSQDQPLFEKVLDKYQVTWVLLDESQADGDWQTEKLVEFLKPPKFSLAVQFGKIKIYRVGEKAPESFVYWAKSLPSIGPNYDWTNFDRAFLENGHYLSSGNSPEIYYPFRTLFSGRGSEEHDFEIEDRGEYFIFRQKIPAGLAQTFLNIPRFSGQELLWINPQDLSQTRVLIPEVRHYGEELVVFVPKVEGYLSAATEASRLFSLSTVQNCAQFKNGTVSGELVSKEGKKAWRLSAVDANNCSAVFSLPNLPHKFSYLLKIESRHLAGRKLLFWLENLTGHKVDLELFLDKKSPSVFLIQPPMAKDGLGYTLHFDNISIGRQKTVNELMAISANPLPYDFLTGLTLAQKELSASTTTLTTLKAKHPNPTVYELAGLKEEGIIILSQAYHPGWHAYLLDAKRYPPNALLAPIFGKEIKEHVLVNNWENGWKLDSLQETGNNEQSRVFLIFLPQYLQYLGFGLLGIAFFLVLSKAKK